MGQPGMGVMINYLCGNEETVKAHLAAINKVIESAKIDDNVLILMFTDKTGIKIWDDDQSCCESRYIRTDDKPEEFNGAIFLGCELREAPDVPDEYGDHDEVQFLLVNTSRGTFTLETHNEHNGCYGGFDVVIRNTK